MATRIERATESHIPQILKVISECGLSVSEFQLRHYFFEVPMEVSKSPVRGGFVVVDDVQGVVGFQGLMPTRVYVGRCPYDGYILGITGLKPQFGSWLVDLMQAERQAIGGSFAYANTANAKSAKMLRLALGMSSGPKGGALIRYAITDIIGLTAAVLSRHGKLGYIVSQLVLGLTMPVRAARRRWASMRFRKIGQGQIKFSDKLFEIFWQDFLASNRGCVTSREPQRLNWRFAEELTTGRSVLVVEMWQEKIQGYAVLHKKYMQAEGTCRLQVVDWCAIGNDKVVLDALLDKCQLLAVASGACVLEYVGAPGEAAEALLGHHLPCRRAALANTFCWMSNVPEIAQALQGSQSWFFGPYDGDRCME